MDRPFEKTRSKHGLEIKYKKHRRGQGDTTKKKQSLKNQLRSEKRKLQRSNIPKEVEENIRASIKSIEDQMAGKQVQENERNLAIKYHKVKFFEKQKLTRLRKKLLKSVESDADVASHVL